MNDEIKIDVLQNIYNENAKNYRYFLDWRYKVMLRYIFSFVSAIILLKIILDNKELVPIFIICSPALIISISSIVVLGMDTRNDTMIEQARQNGENIENKLLLLSNFEISDNNLYGFFNNHKRKNIKFTYTRILNILYKATSIFFILMYIIGTAYLYYAI